VLSTNDSENPRGKIELQPQMWLCVPSFSRMMGWNAFRASGRASGLVREGGRSWRLVHVLRRMFRFVALLFAVLLCVSGCDSRKTAKVSKPEDMYKAIKALVPPGTVLAAAEKTMTDEGFSVENRKDGKWKGRDAKHLYCLREDGQIIKRRWEFALFYETQSVTGLDLKTGLILP
jgi:hypothetical protein